MIYGEDFQNLTSFSPVHPRRGDEGNFCTQHLDGIDTAPIRRRNGNYSEAGMRIRQTQNAIQLPHTGWNYFSDYPASTKMKKDHRCPHFKGSLIIQEQQQVARDRMWNFLLFVSILELE